MNANIERLRRLSGLLEDMGANGYSSDIVRAVDEIERLRAQNVGADVGEEWVLAPRRATPEMIHVMRYGEYSAKLIAIGQKPEVGETPWPRFGEPLAQEAYQAALAAAPSPQKRGSECGAPSASPEIHQPAQ